VVVIEAHDYRAFTVSDFTLLIECWQSIYFVVILLQHFHRFLEAFGEPSVNPDEPGKETIVCFLLQSFCKEVCV